VLVNGSVVGEERDRRFQKFNTHSKTRLLFGNIQAAGTGWSCNSCSTVAFVELPWTPGDLVQAEDRCHGINRGIAGQTTTVYYLLGEGTIEEKLCSSLQSKQKILSQTLDGGEQDTDINIHSLLRQLLTQHGEGFVK
jgi:SNF2 family DNA or RNA helicase